MKDSSWTSVHLNSNFERDNFLSGIECSAKRKIKRELKFTVHRNEITPSAVTGLGADLRAWTFFGDGHAPFSVSRNPFHSICLSPTIVFFSV